MLTQLLVTTTVSSAHKFCARTFVHKVCRKRVSRWCVSSCVGEGLSCSWRRSCSLDTCEAVDRNEDPCDPTEKKNSSDIAEDGNTSIEEEVKCQ